MPLCDATAWHTNRTAAHQQTRSSMPRRMVKAAAADLIKVMFQQACSMHQLSTGHSRCAAWHKVLHDDTARMQPLSETALCGSYGAAHTRHRDTHVLA
jgi:hypothetical protein